MTAEPSKNGHILERTAFRTSRLMDFFERKELIAQTGHEPEAWPVVILKELVDNALDACEDEGIAPVISVKVNKTGIEIGDNGPGMPPQLIESVLDFSVRVSSREAYVAPDRGAQGNALKTIVAMPFVLDGEEGRLEIEARGIRHEIAVRADKIRGKPIVDHRQQPCQFVKNGTRVRVYWPTLACSHLTSNATRFLQIADDFTYLNPHMALHLDWFGEEQRIRPSDPSWTKWLPREPTSAHWYQPEHFERLVAGYIAVDMDAGKDRTVRELVSEFRGLTGSAKQREVLADADMARTNLSQLANGTELDRKALARLLGAMKRHSKPVKPIALGVIGREHLAGRFTRAGCIPETFHYWRTVEEEGGVPSVSEGAFAYAPTASERRLITGVNWSPGIRNPFRQIGTFGQSLDAVLAMQRADATTPVFLLLHVACARVEYTDRGKSAVVMNRSARSNDEDGQ
jgi:DNA topoisomerase VI subunit B